MRVVHSRCLVDSPLSVYTETPLALTAIGSDFPPTLTVLTPSVVDAALALIAITAITAARDEHRDAADRRQAPAREMDVGHAFSSLWMGIASA